MKIRYLFIYLLVLFSGTILNAKELKIVQDNEGKLITATFNKQGIIESLKGQVSEYYVDDELTSLQNDNIVKIHKSMSGDGCYNIEIKYFEKKLIATKIFEENKRRDNLTYTISFDTNNDYFIRDDFVTIKKDEIKSEIPVSHSDSYLPMLKYKDNICIQYFGKKMPEDDVGSRKYVYSSDKRSVECYEIMPGDVWQKYMTATVFDFKSEDIAINLINYIILYNYDYQLGVMLFPILFDLDESKSDFIDIDFSADSYLTEGAVKYLPENLKNTALGTPWVEGNEGSGIGSKIYIKAKSDISKLIISNGFNSTKKYIFGNNNRVQKIKITDLMKTKNSVIIELPDSVEPFEIILPFSSMQLKLEILSVYKGSKYDDTCINYILAK